MNHIDYTPERMALNEVPPVMRKPQFVALVRWLANAATGLLKARQDANRLDLNARTGESGVAVGFGKVLSRKFGYLIRIINRRRAFIHVWIWKREESQPVLTIWKRDELEADPTKRPVYLRKRSENRREYDFTVRLPYGLPAGAIDLQALAAAVNAVRPLGKTYAIEQDGVLTYPWELTDPVTSE